MVAHDRIGGHVDGEDRGQLANACLYPAPAVVKVLPCGLILTTQESLAHTAVDHVVPRRVGQRNKGAAGHGSDEIIDFINLGVFFCLDVLFIIFFAFLGG